MIKSFKYRIYPTRKQEQILNNTLTTCRYLYNNALEQRITEYKVHNKSLSYVDQAKQLTQTKNEYQKQVHSQVLQSTLKRLDTSFQNFFRRVKAHKNPGFPRFKSFRRYNSFYYPQLGFRLTNDCKRIELSKIGTIKLKYSRLLPGSPKTCIVIRDIDQWFVVLTCNVDISNIPQSTNPPVGIDLGILSLIASSDGNLVENPRHLKKSETKLRNQQVRLSRGCLGSYNRNKQRIRVAKVHRKIKRQRMDFLHKLSRKLSKNYSVIVFEKLNIQNMLKNHKLAKHIADASWNKLVELTKYKAEEAGAIVDSVDPRGTSQTCPRCGAIAVKTLDQRSHICPCGLEEDRDIVSGVVVLGRSSRAGQARIQAFGECVSPSQTRLRSMKKESTGP